MLKTICVLKLEKNLCCFEFLWKALWNRKIPNNLDNSVHIMDIFPLLLCLQILYIIHELFYLKIIKKRESKLREKRNKKDIFQFPQGQSLDQTELSILSLPSIIK